MQNRLHIAGISAAAMLLASCSGNGVAPLTPGASVPASPTSHAALAAASANFTYSANPPIRPFAGGSNVSRADVPAPSTCVQIFGLTCYTPPEMRAAYNVPSTYTGAGQTIVIVDAYGSPTLHQDLHAFDAIMGLPDPQLDVVFPLGQPTTVNGGWAAETSLDVQWAHAIAPAAKIVLAVSPTALASDAHSVEQYAIANRLGAVISMSFGVPERVILGGPSNKLLQHVDSLYQQAKAAHITLVAGAGDLGATSGLDAPPNPEFPASDPLVLAVGGTSLFVSYDGTYQRETAWNDSVASLCPFGCAYGVQPGATGGAPSGIFKAPSYQHGRVDASSRLTADVSYNAGTYTAVLVYMSFGGPSAAGLYFVGGTSAATPQWAGIVALANQAAGHNLGFINQSLYDIAKTPHYHQAFHDVTSGNNGLFGGASELAGAGYDMPTGLGSPDVANLIPLLLQAK